jgi:hypothetical protein
MWRRFIIVVAVVADVTIIIIMIILKIYARWKRCP